MSLQARLEEFRRSGYISYSEDEAPFLLSVFRAVWEKAVARGSDPALIARIEVQLEELNAISRRSAQGLQD